MNLKKIFEKVTEKKPVREIVSFASEIGRKSVAANSASIAFYVFISLIPMFILLCSQLPMTGISKAEMTAAVNQLVPETISNLLTSIISEAYRSRIGVFSFSIIILLWSSSRGVLALIRSLDIVYDERDSRNVLDLYMFSIFYTVCLLVGISVLLVLYTQELTAEEIIKSAMQGDKIYEKVAPQVRKIYIILGATVLSAFIYKVAPAGKRSFLHQLPGALFSAVAISLFSVYFAAYTSGSNIYKSFYGSLTTVSLFLIWIYSCINILLIGGVINSYYKERFEILFTIIRNKFRFRGNTKKKARHAKPPAGVPVYKLDDTLEKRPKHERTNVQKPSPKPAKRPGGKAKRRQHR